MIKNGSNMVNAEMMVNKDFRSQFTECFMKISLQSSEQTHFSVEFSVEHSATCDSRT